MLHNSEDFFATLGLGVMAMEHLKSEGDINLTSRRTEWMAQNLDPETRYWLEEDARYFYIKHFLRPA